VLTGSIRPAVNRALFRVTAFALQIELEFFSPTDPTNWFDISCQFLPPYTLLRLGARQPLCGIGVTSRMSSPRSPEAWSTQSRFPARARPLHKQHLCSALPCPAHGGRLRSLPAEPRTGAFTAPLEPNRACARPGDLFTPYRP